MKQNSRKNKFLLGISFSAFIFSVLSFFAYLIISYNISVSWDQMNAASSANGKGMFLGLYCQPDRIPLLLFCFVLATGFIFYLISRAKLRNLVFFVIDATFFYLIYGSINLAQAIINNTEAFGVRGYEILFQEEMRFDITALLIVSILFFGQIGYYIFSLIKTLERKNRLP